MSTSAHHNDPAQEPLLSDETPAVSGESSHPWQFWRRTSSSRRERRKNLHANGNGHVSWAATQSGDEGNQVDDELDQEEQGERLGWKGNSSRGGWSRFVTYLVVLILGLGLGYGIRYGYDWWARPDEEGHGPMVPPVYTLPPPTGLPRNPAYLINATTAAVASEDITCSSLGLSILKRNGTAVDAAITTTLCIGLLNAFSSGIGGGGFMVIRVPEENGRRLTVERREEGEISWNVSAEAEAASRRGEGVWAIDFRETSPEGSEKEMYGSKKAGRVAAQVGGLAVGVPGELRGLEAAHRMYGRLPWKDLVMPVADLAKGWFVSRELARRIRIFGQFMLTNPTWSAIYAPRGALLVEGEYIQRINYGRTLTRIAEEGVEAFYKGDIAESLVETVKNEGGILSLRDLKNYEAISYPAIHQTYHDQVIYTTDAPSSGGVMLGFLNILEPYNITSLNPLNIHRMIEAMKFAFGARSEITDPSFAKNLTRFEEFYSKRWADEKRALLDEKKTHGPDYYGLEHDTPTDHGTTHLSVVDQWGGAASVTSTVNLIWGSHVMDPKTGIILNDEQDDFSVPGAPDAFGLLPSPWNYPAPGKRPLSSTAPTIIENADGSLRAVLGGSGGSRIFPSIVQVIVNLECGDNLSEAIERPRIHDQVVPAVTTIEVGPEGLDGELKADLESRGHVVGEFDINIGVSEVQAVLIQNGTIYASSDSRKNGIPAGY